MTVDPKYRGDAPILDAHSIAHLYATAVAFEPTGLSMLPCPFCASEKVRWHWKSSRFGGGYVCQCGACGSREGNRFYVSIRAAVEAWNRRAIPVSVVVMPAQLPPSWVDELPPVPKSKAERAGWLTTAWSRLVELVVSPPAVDRAE